MFVWLKNALGRRTKMATHGEVAGFDVQPRTLDQYGAIFREVNRTIAEANARARDWDAAARRATQIKRIK